jgi:hypothetical protein
MSENIIYKKETETPIEADSIPVSGVEPTLGRMPVSVSGLVNRPTLAMTIKNYVKDRGFAWTLWVPPKVARFPIGYVPSEKFENNFYEDPDDGRLYALLDGDHRKHMLKLSHPDRSDMSVLIVDVENEEEYHKLFYEINFKNRKNASPNETFLHRVLSGEQTQVELADLLEECGVGVQGSPEDGGTVGGDYGPLVNVANFRTAVRLTKTNEGALKEACTNIADIWSLDKKTKIPGDLLGGVSLVHHLYPSIRESKKMQEEWMLFLKNNGGYPMTDRAARWKRDGGDVGNKQCESVAAGIIKEFRSFRGGAISNQHKAKKLSLKKITRLLSKKDAT